MTATLVPIFVCVVLPVAIVLIVFLAAMNSDNNRAKILIKAIEAGNGIDADKLAEALRKPQKSEREILNLRLLRSCIFGLVGLALIVFGVIEYIMSKELFLRDETMFSIMFGIPCLAVGISYLIVYFHTRKEIKGNK